MARLPSVAPWLSTSRRRAGPFPARAGPHLYALALLLAAAVAYAWPLLARLTTAIPGGPSDHDVASFVWNAGWVKHALDDGLPLLRSDAVLLPFGADLRLHTFGLLQGLLAYPLARPFGVVGAYNLVLVASLFLNGAVLYALFHRETGRHLPALAAAACVMLSSPALFHFRVGRPSFASIWIVAAAMLALGRLLARPGRAPALALAACLLAALLTDFQIVFYTALWLALYLLRYLWRRDPGRPWRRRLSPLHGAALVVAVAPFSALFLVVYYPVLATGSAARPGLAGMATFSLRAWDFVSPGFIPYLYGYDFLAAAVLALVLCGWRGRPRFWLLAALFFFLLSLGPFLKPTRLPLPFAAFSLWPPLAHFRTPYRLVLPGMIGLGVVMALALNPMLHRLRPPLASALIAAAILLRLLLAIQHDPFAVQEYPAYDFYRRVAAEPGDFSLLEVPFGVRSGLERVGQGGEILQYYQHVHRRPLINAMVARLDPAVFAFYRRHSSLLFLTGEPLDADHAALAADLDEVLRWSAAGYVLVHGRLFPPESLPSILAFLDAHPALEPLPPEADLAIYRVRPLP